MYNPPHNTIATILASINKLRQSIENISIKKAKLITSHIDGKSKKKKNRIVVELIDQMHETTMVVEENDKDP
jgi:hypothetical protein